MKNSFILLGDSLTFGYGVKKSKSFSYLLSKSISIPVINKGINGDTTASMLNRIYEDVLSKNPDYIFIMGGTNDLLCKRSLSNTIDNLEEMIKECIKITKNVIVGIPPCIIPEKASILFSPCDFYEYTFNTLPKLKNRLIDICDIYSVNYIDLYSLTNTYIQNNKQIYIDGIHLNEYGNNLIFNELKKMLPQSIIL